MTWQDDILGNKLDMCALFADRRCVSFCEFAIESLATGGALESSAALVAACRVASCGLVAPCALRASSPWCNGLRAHGSTNPEANLQREHVGRIRCTTLIIRVTWRCALSQNSTPSLSSSPTTCGLLPTHPDVSSRVVHPLRALRAHAVAVRTSVGIAQLHCVRELLVRATHAHRKLE